MSEMVPIDLTMIEIIDNSNREDISKRERPYEFLKWGYGYITF